MDKFIVSHEIAVPPPTPQPQTQIHFLFGASLYTFLNNESIPNEVPVDKEGIMKFFEAVHNLEYEEKAKFEWVRNYLADSVDRYLQMEGKLPVQPLNKNTIKIISFMGAQQLNEETSYLPNFILCGMYNLRSGYYGSMAAVNEMATEFVGLFETVPNSEMESSDDDENEDEDEEDKQEEENNEEENNEEENNEEENTETESDSGDEESVIIIDDDDDDDDDSVQIVFQ